MKKKVVGLLLAGTMLFGTMLNVNAANTSDDYFRFKVNRSTGSYLRGDIEVRDKYNSTPVYFRIKEAPTIVTRAKVYGNRGTSNTFYNETIGGYAKLYLGVDMTVRSWIYENGGTKALGKLKSGEDKTGTIYGCWSPDSTQRYRSAN